MTQHEEKRVQQSSGDRLLSWFSRGQHKSLGQEDKGPSRFFNDNKLSRHWELSNVPLLGLLIQ